MHRNLRKMRVSELARAVGVTPSLISQIERGSTRPSVATLFALAEALDVSVDVFADRAAGEAPEPAPATAQALAPRSARESRYVVRRPDRRSIAIDGGIRWELLSPETEPDVEFLELVYEPHAESSPTLYRHPGKELVRVVAGAFEIHIGFDVFRPAGTYFVFCSAVGPNGPLIWDVPTMLKGGENAITLTAENAELVH